MAVELSEEQTKQVRVIAHKLARRAMTVGGGDPKNVEAYKQYWQENRRLFVSLSRTARKHYLGS